VLHGQDDAEPAGVDEAAVHVQQTDEHLKGLLATT